MSLNLYLGYLKQTQATGKPSCKFQVSLPPSLALSWLQSGLWRWLMMAVGVLALPPSTRLSQVTLI